MKRLYILMCFVALASAALAQAPSSYELESADKVDPAKAITIFPNPATDFIHVNLENVRAEGIKVTIHNLIGNEMTNVETEKTGDHELKIRVKDFDAGYYLLALKDENSRFKGIYKFVKR